MIDTTNTSGGTASAPQPHTGGMDVDLVFGGLVAAKLPLSFAPLSRPAQMRPLVVFALDFEPTM